jgi:hypothetical protein
MKKRIQQPELAEHANALGQGAAACGRATKAAWATGEPGEALANAVPYMQAFGHTVLAWIWLDVAARQSVAARRLLAIQERLTKAEWARYTLFLSLRITQDRRLAQGGSKPAT